MRWRRKKKEKDKQKLIHRLRSKFRLVIINDTSFEERFSLMLSPMNIFIWFGSFSILLVVITTLIIAYTPLREYIPGYVSGDDRKASQRNELRADSLERELNKYDAYLRDLKIVLSGGDFSVESVDSVTDAGKEDLDLDPSAADLNFREKMKDQLTQDNVSIPTAVDNSGVSTTLFFRPLDGQISQEFDPQTGHFGIDIVGGLNGSIKSTLDGTVLFADWTADGGHEIHVQHANNIVSVYKHNSVLLKKTGDQVNAGDPIAIMGNTGKQTDGPHLHFEIWIKGKPVDPQNFMAL